jgi:hypothetical protein
VNEVTVEWLSDFDRIESIADVANDQGRQVRLEWSRSGYDFLGSASPIVEYAVYRRIESALKTGNAQRQALELSQCSPAVQEHALAMLSAGGDFITTVPVRVEDRYAMVVPTLADSTVSNGQQLSTFMVSALTATPGVFFDSPPDSGYSVDNLAPEVPAAMTAAYQTNLVILNWADATEADFGHYRIYRDTDPAFIPDPTNLVHTSTSSGWNDPTASPWNYVYKVTALDHSGNESASAAPGTITDAPSSAGHRFALHDASPNPFNPRTMISYEIGRDSPVHLRVYDSAGRLVRMLVDEKQVAGRHDVIWEGRDSANRTVASGVYRFRIDAAGFSQSGSVVLLK